MLIFMNYLRYLRVLFFQVYCRFPLTVHSIANT